METVSYRDHLNPWLIRPNTSVFFESSYALYSLRSAGIVVSSLKKILSEKDFAVLVTSSGKSPIGLYRQLFMTYKNAIDWKKVHVFQMDEYWGVPCNEINCMSKYLEDEFVKPLGITHYAHYFDKRGNLKTPLNSYESMIRKMGGIDLVVHGVGRNGHIGFNEPSTPWDSPTQKVTLTDSTLVANFGTCDQEIQKKYGYGVTLGLKILTEAKHALVLFSGQMKNEITRKFLTESPTVDLPVTSVSLNKTLDCIIDMDSITIKL